MAMKTLFAITLTLISFTFAIAQNEQSPIVEKDIAYKDWTYKNSRTGEDTHLRDLIKGKKLAIVIYYAPWCHNWQHDAPMVERLYEKYKAAGLEVVAVSEYDLLSNTKANLDQFKITFPAVYESESRNDKQTTSHYNYRKSTGDSRGWGSPYYVFLSPANLEKKGDVLTKKTFVINGEMIDVEGEKFIREHLGLPAETLKPTVAANGQIEVCDPAKPSTPALKKP
jgi:thiol-disulfide isomerase/thioredoxin